VKFKQIYNEDVFRNDQLPKVTSFGGPHGPKGEQSSSNNFKSKNEASTLIQKEFFGDISNTNS